MTDNINQIFFSYAHKDSSVAFKLANRLRNNGVPIWMDDGLKPGRNWQNELRDEIVNSRALIALISPHYILSEWCHNEISLALALPRVIYPVLVEKVRVEQFPLGVGTLQYADFTNWFDDTTFETAFASFLSILHEDNRIEFTSPPSPEKQYRDC